MRQKPARLFSAGAQYGAILAVIIIGSAFVSDGRAWPLLYAVLAVHLAAVPAFAAAVNGQFP
jgi:hypothetical protein